LISSSPEYARGPSGRGAAFSNSGLTRTGRLLSEAQPGLVGSEDYAAKKPKASSTWEPFDGVLKVDDAEFARFMECMTNPGEPTEGVRRGAALLKKLNQKR
jgi:hypothetical protein